MYSGRSPFLWSPWIVSLYDGYYDDIFWVRLGVDIDIRSFIADAT